MSNSRFRVATRDDGTSWVYRDGDVLVGPFPTLESALVTVNYLEDGIEMFPRSRPDPRA